MKYVLLVVLMALGVAPVRAQHAYYEMMARYSQARIYHEAFALPGQSEPSVVVTFRIPNSRLVFVRNRQETPGRLFVAGAEVTVQLFRDGRKVGEEVWRREHFAASFEDTQRKDLDLAGLVRFDAAPGRYGYRLLLKDEHADRSLPALLEAVDVPDFGAGAVGPALVVRQAASGAAGVALTLANVGGALPYGEAAAVAVPVGLPAGTAPGDVRVRYALYRQDPEQVREDEQARQALLERLRRTRRAPEAAPIDPAEPAEPERGEAVREGVVEGAALLPAGPPAEATLDDGRLAWPAAAGTAGYLARIDLDAARLPDGAYVLDVTLEDASGAPLAARAMRLRTHWRNMPVSLYSPEAAIRNLSFIADKKTVRGMLRGSRAEQEAAVRAFWAERDPTPGTAFNELMAEYYRRVDDAANAFKTGRYPFPDGLETDRARIYIVHGPADRVERTFPPSGGVEEVWHYAGGERYVFWAPTSLDPLELRADGSR